MQIVRESIDLAAVLTGWRAAGETIALVPTMGALHAGHMALIDKARTRADRVIATIFVNPLQFGIGEDLDRYPRQEQEDAAKLEAAGANLLWMPSVADLYPRGFATTVSVAGVSEQWEGAHRPGHFDGVATVVAKLFLTTMPDFAIFGEKDFQQLAVIRRMTADLGIPIEVIGLPTVRDGDGLALSSRNALLSPEHRELAATLARRLREAAGAIGDGGNVDAILERTITALEADGFGPIDYVAYVESDSLEPIERYRDGGRLIAAVFLGDVRLIDNRSVISATA